MPILSFFHAAAPAGGAKESPGRVYGCVSIAGAVGGFDGCFNIAENIKGLKI